MSSIASIYGREILDSRGNPTVEVDILLDNGFLARAAVPSGASTGEFEACELRDGNKKVYLGKGVLKAVEAVNGPIAKLLKGKNPLKQRELDDAMIALDGTANKSKLGANALLGASMAITVAAANVSKMPVWKYIAKLHKNKEFSLPTPMANIINGGKHADNMIDFQEFMIMPVGAKTFSEGLQWITEVFHALKSILKKGGHVTAVGDEGGFAPNVSGTDEALNLILEAITNAGYEAGRDVVLATDNLKDLPAKILEPFGVFPLHPGDVLQLVYQIDPRGVACSLQKTAADFKNPAFSLKDMLASIGSAQQFDNQDLAADLAVSWGLADPGI